MDSEWKISQHLLLPKKKHSPLATLFRSSGMASVIATKVVPVGEANRVTNSYLIKRVSIIVGIKSFTDFVML